MSDYVSLNGQLVESHMASIGIHDRGFLLGDGLFEAIRIKDGQTLALTAHLSRLRIGADVLGFPQFDFDFKNQIDALVKANGVEQGVVRLTLSRGEGKRGVLPSDNPELTVLITAASMVLPMTPIRLHVSHVTRRNEFSPLFRIKTVNYLENILVRQAAARYGADDSIMLNTTGLVTETSIANLLFKRNGKWVTPPVHDGVLPGTSRGTLISAGLLFEHSLQEADLVNVESAIAVNALCLRAITQIDEQVLALPTHDEYKAFADCLDF